MPLVPPNPRSSCSRLNSRNLAQCLVGQGLQFTDLRNISEFYLTHFHILHLSRHLNQIHWNVINWRACLYFLIFKNVKAYFEGVGCLAISSLCYASSGLVDAKFGHKNTCPVGLYIIMNKTFLIRIDCTLDRFWYISLIWRKGMVTGYDENYAACPFPHWRCGRRLERPPPLRGSRSTKPRWKNVHDSSCGNVLLSAYIVIILQYNEIVRE